MIFVVMLHAFPHLFPGGWMGVDIFFVLSGYLITTLLTREIENAGAISYGNFYVRRALRLMPAAACIFAFELVRALHSPNQTEILQATLVSALYFMNWSRAFALFPQDIIGHMWSLSVEEQFYLLWPVTLSLIFGRHPIRWIIALIAAVILWRCYIAAYGATADRTYNGFDTHADALLMGCLISFIPLGARKTLARFRWLAVGFFLISLFTVRYDAPVLQYLGMTGVAGAAVVMVCSSLESNGSSSILILRPLVFTGKISYGWYLWHYPLIALIAGHASSASATGKMLATGGAIALSYMVATASYFLIERPFLRMKTRFVANKVSSGAEAKPAQIAT